MLVFGQSFGCAAAVHAATRFWRDVSHVVLENPFRSLRRVVHDSYRWVLPVLPLMRAEWNTEEAIRAFALETLGVARPALPTFVVIAGGRDTEVPHAHKAALLSLLRGAGIAAHLHLLPDRGHNDCHRDVGYFGFEPLLR